MNSIVSALVGSGATGLTGWVIMSARLRRKEKGDRIGDLRLDVDRRFTENREDMNRRFDEQRADSEKLRVDLEELRADTEKGFSAVLYEIKGLEQRLVGELKAQGERIDRVHDVLRNHGERLGRIEAKLEVDPPAEAA